MTKTAKPTVFIDQMQRRVEINFPPKRIISLVPSQTELLYDLDLNEEVVGITKFCIHPKEWFKNKNRIGGTKNVDISKIKSLQPDLIIANKEENTKEDIEQLEQFTSVWVSDITTLQDATEMIQSIGELSNRLAKAVEIINNIQSEFTSLKKFISTQPHINKTCTYLIWQNPYMTIGCNTFINSMLSECGLQNMYSSSERYPEISIDELKDNNPDLIFLSSEPFPFKDHHVIELEKLLPTSKIALVDGEIFSWYGSKLIKAPDYFKKLIIQLYK